MHNTEDILASPLLLNLDCKTYDTTNSIVTHNNTFILITLNVVVLESSIRGHRQTLLQGTITLRFRVSLKTKSNLILIFLLFAIISRLVGYAL